MRSVTVWIRGEGYLLNLALKFLPLSEFQQGGRGGVGAHPGSQMGGLGR